MSDTLARIVADKRDHVARRQAETSSEALAEAVARAEPPRGFAAALTAARAAGRPGLIAEIKKGSPSRGLIRADFDPPALARAYRAGGAHCLSVLTDEPYFLGRDRDLVDARAAVPLPVLRKDFMIDPWQIAESRALGADCVLLIMAALDDAMAEALHAAATGLGMDVLIEIHDEAELVRALRLPGGLIGINNRSLKTLVVDLAVTEALAPLVPPERLLVAESGIAGADDRRRLSRAGAAAFLVGESLMRQDDVTAATRDLLAD